MRIITLTILMVLAIPLSAFGKTIRDIEYAPGLHLDLHFKHSKKRLPVILFIHGGGWMKGDYHRSIALAEVARGYAVASVQYRLSHQAKFPAQLIDCKAAVRWLRAHAQEHNLDPDQIGVWGVSAGGHLAALMGVTGGVGEFDVGPNLSFSSRVKAVVDFYGPVDLLKESGQPRWQGCPAFCYDCADSPESKLVGCALKSCPDTVARANPINYLTNDDPPFLIMHGDKDCRVPLGQSGMLDVALDAKSLSSEFVVVKNAGHGRGFNSGKVWKQVNAFLDKHLKGQP